MQLHIGIDDTDSTKGGCTTYIAARLVEKLGAVYGIRFTDYPNIVRLNPNIPFKTRGNAAVALRLSAQKSSFDTIRETALDEVESSSHIGHAGTDPAVVIAEDPLSRGIKRFSRKALCDVLSAKAAIELVRSVGATAATYGSELGLVGALAAVGQTLTSDHTFELIAYRERRSWGLPRRVVEESVKRMDKATRPMTFNNYDYENKRVLITPHGPDPVLFGIRGESADIVKAAFRYVEAREPIERWVVFRTNHGTDAHLRALPADSELKLNKPAVLRGIVSGWPMRTRGGHVFVKLNADGRLFTCAAYEPTGSFRDVVASLLVGDEVTAYGSLRENPAGGSMTVNLEKMRIHRLVDKATVSNPICSACGTRLKSAGRRQGYKCERCSFRIRDAKKQITKAPRHITAGVYLPTLKAHRHLTKPFSRYGKEKVWNGAVPAGLWHYP